MFSKNSAVIFSSILFLVAGLSIGYLYGLSQVTKPSSVIINNPGLSNSVKSKIIKTELTAKEARQVALADMRNLPDDAFLSGIELASKKFSESGSSSGWKFIFYSKTKNKTYEVLIKDGESRGAIEKDAAIPIQTLKGEMVDSSVLAKSFFGSYSADTEIISLKMYYDTGSKKFLWTIFFPKGSHTIDAEI